MEESIAQLMITLTGRPSRSIFLRDLLADIGSEEDTFWEHASNKHTNKVEASELEHELKFRKVHRKIFQDDGLQYPPAFSTELQALAEKCNTTTRETEIIHYTDLKHPMALVTDEELFIDLSQGLDRLAGGGVGSSTIPCVCPQARIWKRRARGWLLAPEAMRAQGYDAVIAPKRHNYSHRQIFDLMGNSFNSSSFIAAATAMMAKAIAVQGSSSSCI